MVVKYIGSPSKKIVMWVHNITVWIENITNISILFELHFYTNTNYWHVRYSICS